ncbi:HlyD family type I secretion periplasmic adaptor subunit [Govanella unica]|uniref:Membrane fusion protein (MFP) family protein n=1 Tax=Govanella unica TaxID=2975056 RepID=A0A9X3TXA9_9PROT|nr:HlyD family type I secretion periplasmic adaptor subunit [Govania unica]MDA5193671.1 HlyD family type I secretion periplasmic adaptor subunit [Govania unica]
MRDMITRHLEIWKASLAEDKERLKQKITVHEAEFLPAALEILETPASPIGRFTLWAIIGFLLIALLWAIFGHVDIVASATGRIIPKTHAKLIQPAELGVVRQIAVQNGDTVKAGDLLIALDPTINAAESERIRRELLAYHIVIARQTALLDAATSGKVLFHPPQGIAPGIDSMQRRLIDSRLQEYLAGSRGLQSQLAEKRADLKLVVTELTKLRAMQPGLEEQLRMRRELMEKGLNSRLVYLDADQRLADHKKNIALDEDRITKEQAAIHAITQQIRELQEKFRKENLAELADAEDKAAAATQELTKATKRTGLQELRAPVAGLVTQLKIHTIGGVVQPGETLLQLVPEEGLQVEALVLNKDIGFVREDQPVEIKLEAFPFTRYGIIHGKVIQIADDAQELTPTDPRQTSSALQSREPQTLVYPAKISLKDLSINVDGRAVRLQPGMAATVEIKTGKRRIIDYILSPIVKYTSESMRER